MSRNGSSSLPWNSLPDSVQVSIARRATPRNMSSLAQASRSTRAAASVVREERARSLEAFRRDPRMVSMMADRTTVQQTVAAILEGKALVDDDISARDPDRMRRGGYRFSIYEIPGGQANDDRIPFFLKTRPPGITTMIYSHDARAGATYSVIVRGLTIFEGYSGSNDVQVSFFSLLQFYNKLYAAPVVPGVRFQQLALAAAVQDKLRRHGMRAVVMDDASREFLSPPPPLPA